MTRLESTFERDTIAEIKRQLPGCIVLKNDSGLRQGIPDRIVLYYDKWAALEFKRSWVEAQEQHLRPNQGYYVHTMNNMSFAAFIYPENKDEVLDGLLRALQPRRQARVSRR